MSDTITVNTAIEGHPLVGTTHTFRPDLPAYDPDNDRTPPSRLIVGPGMPVLIRAVFTDWNAVPGLDMLYVFVPATGEHTHLSPRELTGGDSENTATLAVL